MNSKLIRFFYVRQMLYLEATANILFIFIVHKKRDSNRTWSIPTAANLSAMVFASHGWKSNGFSSKSIFCIWKIKSWDLMQGIICIQVCSNFNHQVQPDCQNLQLQNLRGTNLTWEAYILVPAPHWWTNMHITFMSNQIEKSFSSS